jgi:hypothetical protein
MEDRRVFARINTKFPITFLDPLTGREGKADAVNISANGICLITDERLSERTPLEVWLGIPDHHSPLYARAEVIWSKLLDSNQQEVGVRLEKAELLGLARILWMRRKQHV